MRTKLEDLKTLLVEEVQKLEKITAVTKKSAHEIAEGALSSPSASGDRYHSENSAKIAEDNLSRVKLLLSQVDESLNKPTNSAECVCYLEVSNKKTISSFYLVENPVYLKNVSLVSSSSPLGSSLLGRKVGEKVSTNGEEITILKIE